MFYRWPKLVAMYTLIDRIKTIISLLESGWFLSV